MSVDKIPVLIICAFDVDDDIVKNVNMPNNNNSESKTNDNDCQSNDTLGPTVPKKKTVIVMPITIKPIIIVNTNLKFLVNCCLLYFLTTLWAKFWISFNFNSAISALFYQ